MARTNTLILALLGLLAACSRTPAARDWSAHPAVVEIEADLSTPIYAVSDIHGAYDRLVALLVRHQIIQGVPAAPERALWAAGPAILVVAGDLIDSGPDALGVIDLLRALETSAAAAGGKVLVTLGNHEAEFFVNPRNKKAEGGDGFNAQLTARGLTPEDVARGTEPRGAWLRQRPFIVRVGRWLFSHAGDTHGRSLAELATVLRAGVDQHDYDAAEITGDTSILQSEDWSTADKTIGARYAQAAGAAHLVFGHNPSGLGSKGEIGQAQDGALFRIDCGMSPSIDYSQGALFRVTMKDWKEIAAELRADGTVKDLWQGTLP